MADEQKQTLKDGATILGRVEAVEWPGEVLTADLVGDDVLTLEQRRRVEALYAAASATERKGPMGTMTPPPLEDLVRLANFILDGEPLL